MSVDHHRLARSTAEKLIQRKAGNLAFDVPERGVDRCNGRHSDRTSAPIGAAIEELPSVFDAVRVAADQAWDDVVLQISGDGELAAIQGGIADAAHSVAGFDDQSDEVAAGACDDNPSPFDFGHGFLCCER